MASGSEFADRVSGRVGRLDLTHEQTSRQARLPPGFVHLVMEGKQTPPRRQRLVKLGNVLSVSVSYLVNLGLGSPVSVDYLKENQRSLGCSWPMRRRSCRRVVGSIFHGKSLS